jgi:hypothetical protein
MPPIWREGETMGDVDKEGGDIDFVLSGDIPPRIPEGVYDVSFVRADKKWIFGKRECMFLWFEIVTQGEWLGQRLYMTCTVPRSGRWGVSHKYVLAWVTASGKSPKRRDRMSTKAFRNKVFRAKVRMVLTTSKGTQRVGDQQYSVIDELLEVAAGVTGSATHDGRDINE